MTWCEDNRVDYLFGLARNAWAKPSGPGGAANPRFVVTSLKPAQAEARHLYETIYCARGEMENPTPSWIGAE